MEGGVSLPSASVSHRARGRDSDAQENVRRHVARELHDRVAQTLTGMLVDVENFKSEQVGWDDVLRQMETIQSSTRQVLTSLRQLLHELRGEGVVNDAFVDSLSDLVSRFEQRTTIEAELDIRPGWPAVLTAPASLNLYRIVEEALANVRMHSGARSVRVVLEARPEGLLAIQVDDDGRGVDTDSSRPLGLGTVGMKERAMFLGGRLKIESGAGSGTTVHAIFPKEHLVPMAEAAAN